MVSNTANHAAAEAAKLSNPSNPRFGNIWIRSSVITQFELICKLWHPKKQGYPIPFVHGIHSSFIDWAHSALARLSNEGSMFAGSQIPSSVESLQQTKRRLHRLVTAPLEPVLEGPTAARAGRARLIWSYWASEEHAQSEVVTLEFSLYLG